MTADAPALRLCLLGECLAVGDEDDPEPSRAQRISAVVWFRCWYLLVGS